ncbi:YraN family protein [Shewanella glacialimarina]|uniref:YraN family protein n=1 Tax=Shewanella glacialimarina TaxID=2590884 RepID=UPI001CF8A0F0|nr:YraN family protein [Shewanella glacialimarina]UCX03343.1 YraN family protein [Shewanella glacialimarina]
MTSGELAEQHAREYLQQQGLTFVTANVRYKFGEIDLIMKQQQTLVFVEVKYRKTQAFGGAINALSAKQINRIRLSANAYLQQQGINPPCRFDVIAINNTQISWIQGCF